MNNHIDWKINRNNDRYIWMINGNGVEALFKQPRDGGAYKLVEIANELIVYELALRLGIPKSDTFLYKFEGRIGIMSIIHSKLNWVTITSQNLQNKVTNLDLFRQLFAFDAWIVNTNRENQEHVIVIPKGQEYEFYAIDESHTLNGCTQGEQKWQKGNVNDINKFPLENVNHLSITEIRSFGDLEPMIKKIEQVQDGTIDGIVDSVCMLVSKDRPQEEQQALSQTCDIIKDLLRYRRDNLRGWLIDWCTKKGKVVLNN